MATFKKGKGFSNKFKKYSRGKKLEIFLPFVAKNDDEDVDTALTELTRRLGDAALAKRIRALQAQYGGVSSGTVPELVTYDWLQRSGYRFVFQAELYGGRATAGGILPDFVVETGAGTGMAWNVQGEYWHGKTNEKAQSDAVDALRMIGQVVNGIRIDKVLYLWEQDLYTKRPQVFQYAIAGIGLR
jgi:hypothetical protein